MFIHRQILLYQKKIFQGYKTIPGLKKNKNKKKSFKKTPQSKWSQIRQQYRDLNIHLEHGNSAQRSVSCYEYPDFSVLYYMLTVIFNEKFNSHFSNNK